MSARKGGLGRGLDALIPTAVMPTEIKTSTGVITANRDEIDLNNISANPKQPRTVFDEDQLTELALSIKEVGLLQPPVVRSIGNGKYQIIMGERRFRAAKLAGLKSIPVIIRQTSDDQLLREALVENIHRLSVLNQHSLEQSDEMVHDLSMAKQLHRREDMRRVGQFDLVCLVL